VTRIVAGSRGGRTLATPPGQGTRPTSDRVREALFSALEAMTELAGCRFADLYAGSGAVGLEAASRGAAAVLLAESDPRVVRVVRANVAALGLGDVCRVVPVKVASLLATPPDEPFDVVFLDPPYDVSDDALADVLGAVGHDGWLSPSAVLVVERRTRSPEPAWPDGVTLQRSRRYGETTLWYGRRS
jgi:16S rRNA (guanine(966)-N(2))-methyltransferase RsmD